ncbi:MAG: SDR family oxidoreductase [Actinomycetota bacterium]|nr:SDR family oxidoreductase [Actinomycetota bacterium]
MARTALVTGGTGGLGVAVVEGFLADGWRVVVPWVAERELERLPPRDGLVLVEADLFDPGSVTGIVARAAEDAAAPLGAVANLVGGFAQGGRIHETPVEDFERQLRLNLRATYLVTQAALPLLLVAGGGAIVCVGTRAALRPFAGAAGYITSKAAVLAFVEAVAVEYRDDGVRCNAVLPSVIDTPANRAAQPDADHDRWVRPEEIAAVIRFLCSDESAPVSGAAIPVYGRA